MANKKQLIELTRELRLPGFREVIIQDGDEFSASEREFLYGLLMKESKDRNVRSKENRIRAASFPEKKLLEEIDRRYLSSSAERHLDQLASLEFIEEKQNVILTGSPGTGKTHLAIALGLEACLKGKRVFFTTVAALVNQLKESRSERTLRSLESRFEKYDLVIIDELGYISFDKEGAELLFTHLSLRAGRSSTIITSNLSFDRWNEVFQDTVLTAALTDRLTHKAYVINMIGDSYRMMQTQEWLERQKNLVAQN